MISFSYITKSIPGLLAAIPTTLVLAFSSAIFGWILGLAVALVRRAKVPVISQICAIFVSFMRGVPMVIALYISYFAIPMIIYNYGLSIGKEYDLNAISPMLYAIIALGLGQAAFSSENFRAALDAIDAGQTEAAYSVGMTKFQALRRVILPQALSIAIPNLGGQFLGLIKGTSLAFYVGVTEITGTAQVQASPNLNFLEAYIMTTIVYEILSFFFNHVIRRIETQLKQYRSFATVK